MLPPSFFKLLLCALLALSVPLHSQVTTSGFPNTARTEAPGTLLSHPVTNNSEPIGRTTSINYLNGWIIIGGESPGSRPGSDLELRVYDVSDPATPVRRLPSDFGLSYANNRWYQGNYGWNAHGTAQYGNLLLPDVLRVNGFGGLVERGGTNGIPSLINLPIIYNRSNQAGPWNATMLWYGTADSDIAITKQFIGGNGQVSSRTLATFDHVGQFGGGDWHPMFFGDLLIFARSGVAGNDGVVVYRLTYHNFEDANPSNDSVTPHYVGSLEGGFQGYWPNLFSDGTGLYVIGSTTDILMAADITEAANPAALPGPGNVETVATLTVSNFTNASYPVYQDNFGFIHNRKVDMTRFIAGDPNPIVLTLNEVNPPRPAGAPALPNGALVGVNTSQMSLPLGNLWLTGGYPIPGFNQGLGVWVHQQEPDTTAPRVAYHIPQANRANYPRFAPLSFLVHEHPRNGAPRNGIDFMVRPVAGDGSLGAYVPGFLIHDFSGNMTFTPDAGLAENTTYQVDFVSDAAQEAGFRDAAGNYIEPYSYRFSTGGDVNANPPPVFTSFTASNYQPAPDSQVTVTAAATGTGSLEYRFNFDGEWTSWSGSASANFVYAAAGRPKVLAQVRDSSGNVALTSLALLVVNAPAAGPRPTQSSTLAVGDDPGGRRVWCVNPDANTVSVLDALSGEKLAEHSVGVNPRSIARDVNGRYWVTCHRSDEIRVLNANGSTYATVQLAYGSAPFGIAPSPDGTLLYATMYGSAQIHRYSAANPLAPPLTATTFPTPRALAISADGARVLATRFISPELQGEVTELTGSLGFTRLFTLSFANTIDGGDRAAGVPNYLAGIAISPNGARAAVVSKQDNTSRGVGYGVGDLTHETTTRAVISFLNLTGASPNPHAEIRHTRRDFDNSDSPSAVAYSPLGDTLFVTLQGNNLLVALDAMGIAPIDADNTGGSTLTSPVIRTMEANTGLAPQSVLVDGVSNRIYTQDFMSRTVTVSNGHSFLVENRTTLPPLATTDTVATELLPAPVLTGKQVFYNAADLRMTAEGYISCATCHVDGGHDGRVWDFTGRGEGLRRTTDLRGRSGLGHGNVHWSGNFDEIQDFEHDIRGPFGGTGFVNLTPQQFTEQHPSPASGKSGLSPELDALAAYVASLTPEHTPRSPFRNANGTLTGAAVSGQAVFTAQNCASCHSGPSFSSSAVSPVNMAALQNVGSQSLLSGSRLGQALSGIDTPTLHGLHASRVFLHHGQAATLDEIFDYAGGILSNGANAEMVGAAGPTADNSLEGGGGSYRGAIGGAAAYLDTGGASSVRFTNVDGGTGGTARIAFRYVRQYNSGTANVIINGVSQSVPVVRQVPDNGWQTSGWVWVVVEEELNAGSENIIEFQRTQGVPHQVNALLVANADVLTQAYPHRRVQLLDSGPRNNLIAYLAQLDGRDANGVPLAPPTPPTPLAPSIVSAPGPVVLAEGNNLHLVVAVAGTGPFSFEWRRGGAIVGTNNAELDITSVQPTDAGLYTCTISNAHGSVATTPALVSINSPLTITTTSLLAARMEQGYSVALAAQGGTSARTWSIVSGVLPPGLTLSPAGVLSGSPTAPARALFTVQVSDASGSDIQVLALDALPVGGFASDPDLILHYTFDEGGGTRVWDSAPTGNNHVTDVPGATWSADGRFGGAYGLNGNAGVIDFSPANQGDLNFNARSDSYTISVWVRTTTGGGYRTAIGKDLATSPFDIQQYRIWTAGSPSVLQGITGNQYGSGLAVPSVADGQWHLLTLVNFLDGATWRSRLYFNDGTSFTQWNSGPGAPAPTLMRVGDTSRGGNPWVGQLDDLRIYRRALAPQEIAALFHAPEPETFGGWLSSHLTPSQLASPGLLAPNADADGNGVANLLEFITGSGDLLPLDVEHDGETVVLTLTRNSFARGITLIVERSDDLTAWAPLAISINGTAFAGDATISETGSGAERTVTVQIAAPEGLDFYRLRAVLE